MKTMPSLRFSVGWTLTCGFLSCLAFLRVWPREPWDLAAFMIVFLVVPVIALLGTLHRVSGELGPPWGRGRIPVASWWQSVLALGLALTLFGATGFFFLRAVQP